MENKKEKLKKNVLKHSSISPIIEESWGMKTTQERFDEKEWKHWHTRCSQFVEIPDSLKDQLKAFIDQEKALAVAEERKRMLNVLSSTIGAVDMGIINKATGYEDLVNRLQVHFY